MKKHFLISLSILCTSSLNAQETDDAFGFAVDYIRGEGKVQGIKIAAQVYLNWLEKYSKNAELYFESSVNFWEYSEQHRHDSNFVLAISPVILYPLHQYTNATLYGEFGIGISFLSDSNFAGKDVGSLYQFEDRLGLVVRYGLKRRHQFSIRYFHYSNAGLSKPNPGLDFVSISYAKLF